MLKYFIIVIIKLDIKGEKDYLTREKLCNQYPVDASLIRCLPVDVFIQRGFADVRTENKILKIWYSEKIYRVATVRALFKSGANRMSKAHCGRTPLDIAKQERFQMITKLLAN